MLPNANAFYGDQWRLQQDNATPHTARTTKTWLAENVPSLMDWPPNSADLSPIENIWPILKNSVEKENAPSVADFQQQIVQKWDSLDVDMLSRLFESLPKRLKACRDARGDEINLKLI